MQTTRLGKSWVLKISIFTIILFIFGCLGLYDALYAYPRRGLEDASNKLKSYLEAARNTGMLTASGVKIPDGPKALDELAGRREQIQAALAPGATTSPDAARQAAFDMAKYNFLTSLKMLWKLNQQPIRVLEATGQTGSASTGGTSAAGGTSGSASGTGTGAVASEPSVQKARRVIYFDPPSGNAYALEGPAKTKVDVSLGALLDELVSKWNKADQPTPLSDYDLPSQWLFVVVGFGGGIYLLVVILRAGGAKYRWEPDALRLTLPSGRALVPADLREVDKTRWHKYYVTLVLTDDSKHTLDLYRYDPLEAWVLELERAAFPSHAESTSAETVSSNPAGSSGESDSQSS